MQTTTTRKLHFKKITHLPILGAGVPKLGHPDPRLGMQLYSSGIYLSESLLQLQFSFFISL